MGKALRIGLLAFMVLFFMAGSVSALKGYGLFKSDKIERAEEFGMSVGLVLEEHDKNVPVKGIKVEIYKNNDFEELTDKKTEPKPYYFCFFGLNGEIIDGCGKSRIQTKNLTKTQGEVIFSWNGSIYNAENGSGINENFINRLMVDTIDFEPGSYLVKTDYLLDLAEFSQISGEFYVSPSVLVRIIPVFPKNESVLSPQETRFSFEIEYNASEVLNEEPFGIKKCYLKISDKISGNSTIYEKNYSETKIIYNDSISAEMAVGDYSYLISCEDSKKRVWTSEQIEIEIVSQQPESTIPAERDSSDGGCRTSWACDEWSSCDANGQQTRTCEKIRLNCYADLNEKPAEIQSCAPVQNLAADSGQQGIFSRITGAVIGLIGNVGIAGVIIFILGISGAAYFVYFRRTKKGK